MNPVRKRLLMATLLGTSVLSGGAYAQEQLLANAPPPRIPVDEHGVNVVTGAFALSETIMQAGPTSGGLAITRDFVGTGWRDSYVGTINSADSVNYAVSIGGSTQVFTKSGTTFTVQDGSASTLVFNSGSNNYTYTLGDGTQVTFNSAVSGTSFAGPWAANVGRMTSIKHPDGDIDKLTYAVEHYCTGIQQVQPGQPSQPDPQPNTQTCYNYLRLQDIATSTGFDTFFSYQSTPNGPPDAYTFTVANVTNYNISGGSQVATGEMVNIATSGTTEDIATSIGTREYTYDASGHILSLRTPKGSSNGITLTYDGSGRVATYNDGFAQFGYTYSDNGTARTTTVTEPGGFTKVYTSDTGTTLVSAVQNERGYATNFTYDASGRLQKVTRPEGDTTQYAFDTRGNVTQVTSTPTTAIPGASIVTKADYDVSCAVAVKCNKPNDTVDGRGNTTYYTYDTTHGGVLTVTLPTGGNGYQPQTRYTYTGISTSSGTVYRLTGTSACATGNTCAGTASETKTTIGYGANLLPTSVTSAAGDGSVSSASAFTYSTAGDLLTVDGPLAGTADTTRYRYGADHQLLGVVGPDPDGSGPLRFRAARYTYDGRGLVTSTEQGTVASQADADWSNFSSLLQQQSTYDGAGHKVTDALISGGAMQTLVQYGYNGRGLPQCTAVRDPAYAASLPGSACQVTASTKAGADQITQLGYDQAGNVTLTIEGVGTSDSATTSTLTYGPDNEQLSFQDAIPNTTNFVYDGFNRLLEVHFPGYQAGANPNPLVEAYTYDANSNLLTLKRRGGNTISYGYDSNDNKISSNQGTTAGYANYTYGYDNYGRPTSIATAISGGASFTHTFGYDALGRKTSEGSPANGGAMTSAYDSAGRRTQLTWPDGFYVRYEYDTTGAMTAVRESGATSGAGVLALIGYDDLGRRTSLSRGDGVNSAYGYDAASRLSSLTHAFPSSSSSQTETYAYDLAGQLLTKTSSNDGWAWTSAYNVDRAYTSNNLNEQTGAGAATLSWGAKGVLTSDGSLTYGYDSNNKLLNVSNGSAQTYDGAGRIYSAGSGGATRFLYDGDLAVAEYNTSNAITNRYIPGPGIDEPLAWYQGGARYALVADRLGSVTAVASDTGLPAAINTFDEYGLPGGNNQGRYQYTGQKYMAEYGLYDYKARSYSPSYGRFLQPDPLGYGSSANTYEYGGSAPTNNVDPSGLEDVVVNGCGIQCLDQRYNDFLHNLTIADLIDRVLGGVSGADANTVVVNGRRKPKPLSILPSAQFNACLGAKLGSNGSLAGNFLASGLIAVGGAGVVPKQLVAGRSAGLGGGGPSKTFTSPASVLARVLPGAGERADPTLKYLGNSLSPSTSRSLFVGANVGRFASGLLRAASVVVLAHAVDQVVSAAQECNQAVGR